METATTAAARRRSDKTAPRGARRRLKEPTHAPELLPAPVNEYGRKLSADTVKWRLARQLLQEGLTQGQIALVVAMVDYAPGGQVTIAAMRTIAKRAGMGRSTAFRHRSDLVARGVVVFDPKHDEDNGAQITSWHSIAPEVFERAGIFFSSPPPSHFGTPPRPGSGHKRDPSSISDLSGSAGSIDPRTNGMEQRARTTARRSVVRSNDLAFADLARAHAEVHAERFRHTYEQAGQEYGPHLAGTLTAKHHEPIGRYLRNLAARALDFAHTRNRFDLTADAIRLELTWKIVRSYFDQQRPFLLDKCYALGFLWGDGGADGKPCDLFVLGPRAFEEWCAELEDGDPAPLVAPPPEPYEPPTDDLDEAREACEELRARAASTPLDEPPHAPELDDIEPDPHAGEPSPEHVRRVAAPHVESDEARAARLELRAAVASLTTSATDTAPTTREPARIDPPTRDTAIGGRSLVAALAEGPSDDAPPPRTRARAACAFGVDLDALKARDERAQQQAYLARIGEIARREALAKARAERAKHPRGGRAHLPTQPHPRAALLAALASLVDPSKGPPTASTTRTTPPPFEGPATPRDEDERAPPLLRDVRPRGEERAPLRRPAPPRRRT